MAYNEVLAERVRTAVSDIAHVTEKKMFGGLAFMVSGKMCINVHEDHLMIRIDPAIHSEEVKRTGARTMIMKGREYMGFMNVMEEGIASQKDFDHWVGLALDYNKRAKASKKNT